MFKTPTLRAAAVGQSLNAPFVGQLALATLAIGYPVARIVLPGSVRPALLIPLLLLGIWYIWQLTRARNLLRSPLGLPLLLCAGALLLSSMAGVAPLPEIASALFDWIEGAVILFLIAHLLASGWRPQLFALSALLASSLFLLVNVANLIGWWVQWAQLWQPGLSWFPSGARLEFGGTQPNQAALLINLGVPLAIAALWHARATWQRWLWGIWLLAATVALFYTSSRGGWLAMVAICATMVLPLLWSAWRARRWRRIAGTLILSGGYAALFVALFIINLQEVQAQRGKAPAEQGQAAVASVTPAATPTPILLPSPTATVPPTPAPTQETTTAQEQGTLAETGSILATSSGRTTFFRWALTFFAERPLLGLGPEGYATRYAQVEPHSRKFAAPHAHNIYLQVLSEGGVLGSGALLFLVGMALRVWWRGWRNTESLLAVAPARPEVYPGGRLLLLACGAAGMGIAVHGLVEVPIINVITMYIALLAVALAPGGGWQLREYPAAPQTTTATSPVGRLWRGILRVHPLHSVLMVAAVLAWGGGISIFWQRSINDALQNQARAALQQGDAARAVNLYDQSIAAYPWEPAAYYERATALAWLAREQPARLPEALEAQATAVTHAPSHGIVAPVNQGALLLAMGAEAQATEVLRAAIETTTPRWAVPRMLLAQIAEHTGDDDTARTRWRQALEREPELADSAACLHSAICGSVPLPETEQAALVAARALSQEADPAALRQIEQLASAWRSVDIWAVGVLAAERANDPQARARFLAAAQAEAENVARDVTPLLAAVLLRDARARGDTEAVRTLAQTWVAARDMRLVPQLTRHLITPTDLALAQELVAAARFLDDPTLLAKAQHRMAFFEDALTRPLP